MKKILLALAAVFLLVLISGAQISNVPIGNSGFSTSIRGGYDVKPMYKNNIPYIKYKGGMEAGASVNYYWKSIGIGADFDYIKNKPQSTYPTENLYVGSTAISGITKTEKGITRMFYGIGPSFKYQPNNKFTGELFLRGGLGSIKGGETMVNYSSPTSGLLFSHNGYDVKNVFSAKAQMQFSYFFSEIVGINAGAYFINHFGAKDKEIKPGSAITGLYFEPVPFENEQITGYKISAREPRQVDSKSHNISSIGVFAGLSFRFPTRNKTKDAPASGDYNLAITAKDKFTKEILPGTDVVVKNSSGDIVYSGTTNSYGVIIFQDVKPNDYTIEGKLYGIALEPGYTKTNEFKPNETLQKTIYYSDNNFIIKGNVVVCNTSTALAGASVVLTNTAKAEQKTSNTDAAGMFVFHALQNTQYEIYAKKSNYFSQTEIINTKNFDRKKTLFVKLEVCMDKTDCGNAIILKNILYDLDKYFIREDAKPELNKLVQFMKDNPEVRVELSSHTDSRASDSYNMTLSQNRANAAADYIVSKGIVRNRIIAKGYGETKLLNRCANSVPCSEAEHQVNRRTEFKVICPDSK